MERDTRPKEEKLEALDRQLTLVKVSLTNAKNQLNAGKVVPAQATSLP